MVRRAVQPLNQNAAAAADAAIAPETGGRPLTCAREDARFRERWMDEYVAHGGQVEEVEESPVCGRREVVADPPASTVTPCPCADAAITSETVIVTDPGVFSLTNPDPFPAGDHDAVLPRDRSRIGVGEEVRLTYSRGFARWTLQGEGRFAVGMESAHTANGTNVSFLAGDVDGTIDIEARGSGCHVLISFQVVAPRSLTCFPTTGVLHNGGTADVGAYMNKRIGPNYVSFANVSFIEQDAFAVATGMWLPNQGNTHNPTGVVVRGSERVKRRGGTWLPISDECYSGTCYSDVDFQAGIAGGFYHDIPYWYGVRDDTPNRPTVFSPIRQTVETLNSLGTPSTSTLDKGGYTVSCSSAHASKNVDSAGEPLAAAACTRN